MCCLYRKSKAVGAAWLRCFESQRRGVPYALLARCCTWFVDCLSDVSSREPVSLVKVETDSGVGRVVYDGAIIGLAEPGAITYLL